MTNSRTAQPGLLQARGSELVRHSGHIVEPDAFAALRTSETRLKCIEHCTAPALPAGHDDGLNAAVRDIENPCAAGGRLPHCSIAAAALKPLTHCHPL